MRMDVNTEHGVAEAVQPQAEELEGMEIDKEPEARGAITEQLVREAVDRFPF